MTNEERAREAAREIREMVIAGVPLRLHCETIILTALDAATAPLVAERERLKQVLKQVRSASYMSDTASWPRAMQAVSEALAEDDRAALAEKEPG